MPNILYPYALVGDGTLAHIDSGAVGWFTCLSEYCRAPMIAKRGDQRAHHFAHKSEADGNTCNKETWLHRAAKYAIKDGFDRAVAAGESYLVQRPCPSHSRIVTWECDLARVYSNATIERSLVPQTISDISFTGVDMVPFILEVVVTHEMTPETYSKYEVANILAAYVRPTTVSSIGSYLNGPIEIPSLFFAGQFDCRLCIAAAEEEKQLLARAEAQKAHDATQREQSRLQDIELSRKLLAARGDREERVSREFFAIRTERREKEVIELSRLHRIDLSLERERIERDISSTGECNLLDDNKGSVDKVFYYCTSHRSRTTQAEQCLKGSSGYDISRLEQRLHDLNELLAPLVGVSIQEGQD